VCILYIYYFLSFVLRQVHHPDQLLICPPLRYACRDRRGRLQVYSVLGWGKMSWAPDLHTKVSKKLISEVASREQVCILYFVCGACWIFTLLNAILLYPVLLFIYRATRSFIQAQNVVS